MAVRRGSGRAVGLFVALVLLAGGLALVPASPAAAATAAGFVDSTVLTGLDHPTTVRFSPDGRVFVAEKSGLIKVFDGLGDPTPVVFADLRTQVHNFWDRGLLGMALSPNFPTDPWVYVLYTRDAALGGTAPRWGTAGATSDPCPSPPGPTTDGCVVSGRLSRLQAAGDTMTGSEQVLIDDWCQQYPSHSIGDLEFGADGALYASAGDGASFTFTDYGQGGNPTNPCNDPPSGTGGTQTPPTAEGGSLRAQDARTTGDPVGLDGTVIRVDPATGAGLPGNPMASSSDPNARRIVADGLRNPFRLARRPGTGEVWVGDVGNATWEEIDRIDTAADATVDDFGWPCYEGDGRNAAFDTVDLTVCEDLYAQPSAVTAPAFTYRHSDPVVAGEGCPTGSSSLSGLEFYEGGAYPSAYDGALFFADYSRDCIWVKPTGAAPQTLVAGAANPVDLELGAGGDLFYVDYDGGTIHRITFTQPQPPTTSSYVSDLAWASSTNGWGPVERDTSNGEQLAGDGTTLTLAGTTYAKGLGTHARSDVRVDLAGNCTRFQSDIGVDDEVGAGGSVVFEVWVDGVRRFQSATLTGTSATQAVDLDVTDGSELRLVVDGGTDVTADHADWAAARLTCGTDTTRPTVTASSPEDGAAGVPIGEAPSATFSEQLDTTTVTGSAFTLTPTGGATPVSATVTYDPGERTARLQPSSTLAPATSYTARLSSGSGGVADLSGNHLAADRTWTFTTASAGATTTYLSDRAWMSATNGWGPVERDRSNGEDQAGDGSTLRLAGQPYAKGLGVHARSEVVYDLAGGCSRFQAQVGIDDEIASGGGSATFEVWTDATRRYQSPVLTADSAAQRVDVDVSGASQLRLLVDGGADVTADHGDWADARVTCGSTTSVPAAAHITAPTTATTWAVGDRIDFSGGATDTSGQALPASALTWTLVVNHCPSTCHEHTVSQFTGVTSGSFVAPDHDYPSTLSLRLAATLPGGGSVTDSVTLQPKTVDLTFATAPAGLQLVVGGTAATAPFTRRVIVGSSNSVSAPSPQRVGGYDHTFASWSDGGARSHDLVAPVAATTYTATFTRRQMPFRAYDDLNGRSGDGNAANVTRFGYTSTNGALVDQSTAVAPGPLLSGSSSGGLAVKTTGGAQAATGTDAARYFGTSTARIVDLGRSIELTGSTWSNTVTISGLDPNESYSITLTANHGDSRYGSSRFTRVTLNGAPTYTNASSAGVVAYAANSVSFNTGYNTARGYVARWVDVDPGSDGRISIVSQWDRSRGTGTTNDRGYAMTALLLEH